MTIYFGGVEMPAPKLNGGLVETYENVWSADTGRNSAGRMMGTLVATKAKLKFIWNALSWADAAKIRNAIYGAGFTTCTYPGVDAIREAAARDLDTGVLLALERTIAFLQEERAAVCETSIHARDWLLQARKEL